MLESFKWEVVMKIDSPTWLLFKAKSVITRWKYMKHTGYSVWWFQTCLILPPTWADDPHVCLNYFSDGLTPPTSVSLLLFEVSPRLFAEQCGKCLCVILDGRHWMKRAMRTIDIEIGWTFCGCNDDATLIDIDITWYYRGYLRVECIIRIKFHTYYLIIMTSIFSHIWCL